MKFRFVHAADLHLDCPFEGLTSDISSRPAIAERIRNATLATFEALIDLCLAREAQFLLLSGDIYDSEIRSLRALFRFRDGLVRLAEHGIRSFIVHGNHDPLTGVLPRVSFPAEVCVFPSTGVTTVPVEASGHTLATVSGISYGSRREERDVSALFPRPSGEGFPIALLHGTVGDQTGHEPYAPCTLTALRESGYAYWALGHVHRYQELSREPYVVYPGSLQGLSIRECGPHGCVVVEVSDGEVSSDFVSLSRIRWEVIELDIGAISTFDELDGAVLSLITESPGVSGGVCSFIFRICLVGSGPLGDLLWDPGLRGDLLARLRDETASFGSPFVWIKDIVFEVQADVGSLEARSRRQDFLGEVLRVSTSLSEGDADLQSRLVGELAEVYESPWARRCLTGLSDDEYGAIVSDAELLCAALLRGDRSE